MGDWQNKTEDKAQDKAQGRGINGNQIDSSKIGRFIAGCRKEKKLTQQQLADELGVTNRAVSKWETGAGIPDITMIPQLAKALGVTMDEIICGEYHRKTEMPAADLWEEETDFQKVRKRPLKCILAGCTCLFAAALGIAMQVVYLTLGETYRMEYIWEGMFFIVNAIVLFLMLAAMLCFVGLKKKSGKAAAVLLALLFFINMTAGIFSEKETAIIRISPGFQKMLVLKYNEDTGKMLYYRNQILWFARPSAEFPYTVEGDVKTQWLEDDICAVTYRSPDDGNVHQFVATYGDRGNGITTPYVYNLIDGSWAAKGNESAGYSIRTGMDGIVIENGGGEKEIYAFDDCVQFGSLAIVLCKNGLPQWTISLDKESSVGENDLLKGKSIITLCRVSMEKTAPMKFKKTGSVPDYSEMSQDIEEEQHQAGKVLVQRMKDILKDDPDLSDYILEEDYLKVVDRGGIFDVIKETAAEEIRRYLQEGESQEVQILTMEVLAGDDADFLAQVFWREYSTPEEIEQEGLPSVIDMQGEYRIRRGEGVYLAAKVHAGTDGTALLEAPVTRQKLEAEELQEYHFNVTKQTEVAS